MFVRNLNSLTKLEMDLDAVSFHLPDSLILTGNDYDEDDARHDEINQKEVSSM